MQIMEGDIIRTIRSVNDRIGLSHTAGNSGLYDLDEDQDGDLHCGRARGEMVLNRRKATVEKSFQVAEPPELLPVTLLLQELL
jgi:hypothetical protein